MNSDWLTLKGFESLVEEIPIFVGLPGLPEMDKYLLELKQNVFSRRRLPFPISSQQLAAEFIVVEKLLEETVRVASVLKIDKPHITFGLDISVPTRGHQTAFLFPVLLDHFLSKELNDHICVFWRSYGEGYQLVDLGRKVEYIIIEFCQQELAELSSL
jgi:hypothetical protein